MNRTAQNGEKSRYKVILLLVVGLATFSSAMKDLNQLRQFAGEANDLVANLSEKFPPAEVPAVPQTIEIQHTVAKVATCQLKQSAPSVELPWLTNVRAADNKKPKAIVPRPSQVIDFKQDMPDLSEIQIAKLKKLPQIDFDSTHFGFRIDNGTEPDTLVISETQMTPVKTRTRRQREIKSNPRDREIFLKTLNRSINLRFAS